MKRKTLILLSLLFSIGFFIHKPGYSLLNVEITAPFSTQPKNSNSTNVGSAFGVGFGLGIDLGKLSPSIMSQFRMDASYQSFGKSGSTAEMYPVFLGMRLMFGNSSLPKWLVPYLDFGYTAFFQKSIDQYSSSSGQTVEHGAAVGLGSEFFIYKKLYFSIGVRYNMNRNSYLSILPAVGYRF